MKKLTILTVNFNDKDGLIKTIESVKSQKFTDFEFIVIDGGSSDGSAEILKEYPIITKWVSEKDNGIYHAMNKGIKMAGGDYLLFLNSGDHLYDKDTIQKVVNKIDGSKDLYYGDAVFKRNNTDEIVTYPDELSFYFFTHNSLCHQASFIKRTLFEEIFYYNEELKIISDWEFMVYAVCLKNISYKHLDIIVSYYDFEGISSRPDSVVKIKEERAIVMNKYFSLFIEDYNELAHLKHLTALKRIQNVLYIKQFPFAWKLLKGFSNFLLFFLPKQK